MNLKKKLNEGFYLKYKPKPKRKIFSQSFLLENIQIDRGKCNSHNIINKQ